MNATQLVDKLNLIEVSCLILILVLKPNQRLSLANYEDLLFVLILKMLFVHDHFQLFLYSHRLEAPVSYHFFQF